MALPAKMALWLEIDVGLLPAAPYSTYAFGQGGDDPIWSSQHTGPLQQSSPNATDWPLLAPVLIGVPGGFAGLEKFTLGQCPLIPPNCECPSQCAAAQGRVLGTSGGDPYCLGAPASLQAPGTLHPSGSGLAPGWGLGAGSVPTCGASSRLSNRWS